ncbi:hypothetical protein HJ187_14510 [Vibrio parahaemolyticus]|nr:hypothetical protein [Vibrio parahaemolyticus]
MIKNIPTNQDFYKTGRELLDLAWDMIAKLLMNLNEGEYYGVNSDEISEEYWSRAKRQLTTSLSITQQGIEFLIKGRICQISPFLLISESPSKWPSPYEGKPIDFSQFRSIDAQDLVRVHDTFSEQPFDKNFVQKFNELREIRNIIMHSVGSSLDIKFNDIIDALLFMHHSLFPDESWANIRKNSLENSPNIELGSGDFVINEVCRELSIIIDILSPKKVKEYFNIDKKMRPYLCPNCYENANHDIDYFEYKLARLVSKEPKCDQVYCPVCDKKFHVIRQNCEDEECQGNVISNEFDMCLTCG